MTTPSLSAGDMWRWHNMDTGKSWTVILVSPFTDDIWNCLCLEDGNIEHWLFTEAEMADWEFVA